MATDPSMTTQADLTERARAVWHRIADGNMAYAVTIILAALQSERVAAAAEARNIIRDLAENFGAGGPKANKAFAVATRYLLASPPAPQEEMASVEHQPETVVLRLTRDEAQALYYAMQDDRYSPGGGPLQRVYEALVNFIENRTATG